MSGLRRRQFIQESAALVAGATVVGRPASSGAAPPPAQAPYQPAASAPFQSRWSECHDRVWLGADYWANPLQDWHLKAGRIECLHAALDRHVHLLTRQLGEHDGELEMRVRLGPLDAASISAARGSAGFRIGLRGPLPDYRNALLFGTGLDAGLTAAGGLFIGKVQDAVPGTVQLGGGGDFELRLTARPSGGAYLIALEVYDPTGKLLGRVERPGVPRDALVGNLALASNFGRPLPRGKAKRAGANAKIPGAGRWWFADWRIEGSKLEAHDERAFGPLLFNHYTLSGGVMKMTAQLPPVGAQESQTVRLEVKAGDSGDWQPLAEAAMDAQARTATFRIEKWDDRRDTPYRLAYTMTTTDGKQAPEYLQGTVRRDPVDRPELSLADISCNTHAAFPNAAYVANVAALDPDMIAFVGDQFYESSGGYGTVQRPLDAAILDYLRKWYLHGWTWRTLTCDRPSVSLPDDHDMYQGNIWGAAGAARHGTQEMGGYDMPAAWVNVVHRTQTAHHPDPYDPTPIDQGISVYYGPLTYGRISFAILADRMFKTGPEGKVPATGSRGDHVVAADFDPRSADIPGAELLGERQLKFLRAWAADWRQAEMKAVISQTIFSAMATTHGGTRERLRADYDANGWPQTARNQALREIRKAFAAHIAGDQHLPAVIHYGIDQHRDGPVAFAGPAVNVGYPRWWEPEQPGENRAAGAPENTGDFLDHFGNRMTVLAVANGAIAPRQGVLEMLADRASGLGLVRFNKLLQQITFECWPLLADPASGGRQFPGWPVSFNIFENYGREAVAHLPALEIGGLARPVVQIVSEQTGEIEYTIRLNEPWFKPKVFALGHYTVRVIDPEGGRVRELPGLEAAKQNDRRLRVEFG
jgi:phosphodiesterase/alkaline phosphatase D-like protein